MATKDEILSILRREMLTIAEMSKRLGLARNAIVQPLRQLEANGLVESMLDRQRQVGKPAHRYRIIAGREDNSSTAYPAFAEKLVASLSDYLDSADIERLLVSVGEKLAKDLDVDTAESFENRLKTATDFTDSLGADTDVSVTEEGSLIESYSCPLGRAVRCEAHTCRTIATFFEKATGQSVETRCIREDFLKCRFLVKKEESR